MPHTPETYDAIYKDNDKYSRHFSESIYYPVWQSALKYISGRVLELGCGTGQFAQMLMENKKVMYLGVDYSQEAIKQAKQTNPELTFLCDDVFSIPVPGITDTIVAFELFEHIEHDLQLIKKFPHDKKVVFSVPNFPASNHHRYFTNRNEVKKRYGAIKIELIEAHKLIKNKYGETNIIFLCVGRKR